VRAAILQYWYLKALRRWLESFFVLGGLKIACPSPHPFLYKNLILNGLNRRGV
jgi:hypothetical protein